MSSTSLARVVSLTVAGTLLCISVAMAIDSFSFGTMTWRWGSDPLNNVVIPAVLAPPLLFLLLWKMRELAMAHREVLTAASTDSLTQCLNRRAFTAMVEGYLESLRGSGALLVIDVDHFKSVNDTYGHVEGDKDLELIAGAIKGSVRSNDLVARMGGEEFSVFLPATDASGAAVAGKRSGRGSPRRSLRCKVAWCRSAPVSGAYLSPKRDLSRSSTGPPISKCIGQNPWVATRSY